MKHVLLLKQNIDFRLNTNRAFPIYKLFFRYQFCVNLHWFDADERNYLKTNDYNVVCHLLHGKNVYHESYHLITKLAVHLCCMKIQDFFHIPLYLKVACYSQKLGAFWLQTTQTKQKYCKRLRSKILLPR